LPVLASTIDDFVRALDETEVAVGEVVELKEAK